MNARTGAKRRGKMIFSKPLVKMAFVPCVISAAPNKPPIIAWVEDEGIPCHQENKLQITAEAMPNVMVLNSTADVSISPVAIDRATANPNKNGAIKSATPISKSAIRGFTAREAITPDKILDESRYPFKKA